MGWFRERGVRECWLVHQLTGRVEVLQFERGTLRQSAIHSRDERILSGVLPEFDGSLASMTGYTG